MTYNVAVYITYFAPHKTALMRASVIYYAAFFDT